MSRLSLRPFLVGAAIAVVLLAVVLAGFDQGWLAGLTLAVAIVGAVTSWWKPALRHPRLIATLVRDGEVAMQFNVGRTNTLHPIKRNRIRAAQINEARSTIPPPPERAATYMPIVPRVESYDDALERFEEDLEEYDAELGKWLETYDSLRWPESAYFEALARIENEGDVAAQAVKLRLTLPDGLELVEGRPTIAPPPQRPTFEILTMAQRVAGTIDPSQWVQDSEAEPPLGTMGGPTLIREDGQRLLEFNVSTVGHGERELSSYPVRLSAEHPGTYRIPWVASASNLKHPATGELTLEVLPQPRAEEPIEILGDLLRADTGLIERQS